jgi:hypothetical protein
MQMPAPENASAAANRGFIGHEVDEGLQFLRHGGHQADGADGANATVVSDALGRVGVRG